MAGYSTTPLWKKLGYKNNLRVHVDSAPARYREALMLPRDVVPAWAKTVTAETQMVHLFVSQLSVLRMSLASLRRTIAPDGVVWVSWPKKTSGTATDITENVIRSVALPLGFVDIKVCAVDEQWSGLKLVVRKSLR